MDAGPDRRDNGGTDRNREEQGVGGHAPAAGAAGMTWDHRRVEELLAARAVDGLDPEDAALAERALIEHVPDCHRCREALDAYALVAGDLALVADPTPPPDTLEARLRRSIRRRRRRLRGAGWTAAGVAAVVALSMAGWNAVLSAPLSEAEQEQASLTRAFVS